METGVAVAYSDESRHDYAVQMFGRPRSAAIEFANVNEAGKPIEYRVGEQLFSLPPCYTRTHQQCRPSQVTFLAETSESPNKETVQPERGDRFIVRQVQGKLRLEELKLDPP